MSEPLEAKRTTTAVKCERHGLHYDPSRTDGCVICRREAGGWTATARGAGSAAAAAPSGSMGQALAVTAVLLLLTTACLYFVHGMVIGSFQGLQGGGEMDALDGGFEDPLEEMPEMPEAELPEEDEGGPVYSGSEGD